MSGLADLIAIERSGHKCMGYRCECGVTYSARRPTADHIQHVREIADAGSQTARIAKVDPAMFEPEARG